MCIKEYVCTHAHTRVCVFLRETSTFRSGPYACDLLIFGVALNFSEDRYLEAKCTGTKTGSHVPFSSVVPWQKFDQFSFGDNKELLKVMMKAFCR